MGVCVHPWRMTYKVLGNARQRLSVTTFFETSLFIFLCKWITHLTKDNPSFKTCLYGYGLSGESFISWFHRYYFFSIYAGTSPLFSDSLTLSGMTLINLSYFQRSGPTWTPTMMHGRLGRRMGWIQWVQLKSGNGIPDEGPSIKNSLDKKRGGWQRQVVTLL